MTTSHSFGSLIPERWEITAYDLSVHSVDTPSKEPLNIDGEVVADPKADARRVVSPCVCLGNHHRSVGSLFMDLCTLVGVVL